MMRIVHIAPVDCKRGAARAAFRLHKTLENAGHTSTMLVKTKHSNDQACGQFGATAGTNNLGVNPAELDPYEAHGDSEHLIFDRSTRFRSRSSSTSQKSPPDRAGSICRLRKRRGPRCRLTWRRISNSFCGECLPESVPIVRKT